jgi:DNA-binding response OmpR family regulator
MHWEKATSWAFVACVLDAPPPFAEPAEPEDDGLLPQAVPSSASAAVARIAAAVRGAGRHGRRVRRMTRILSSIVSSSGLAIVVTASAHVRRDYMPQFYTGTDDITATGDVAWMSCEPAHTGDMRVLVVEDHATLADRIAQGLRQAGMAVDAVHDGAAALEAAAQAAYDVIVLDRDLPVVHGDRVCRTLAGGGPRILMLTAAADVDDRVDGLELGADDYLPKPFAFAELIARVRALSRRAPSVPPVLQRGTLTVDRARHRASRGGRTLSLTRKEFGILEMLLTAGGAVVSAEELLEHVWDAHADPFSNIVSVTMARLRRKLGDPPLIETVVGKGYRM